MRRPRPIVGAFNYGSPNTTMNEDAALVTVRYWDNWARARLELAKLKWNHAFQFKTQWQPALVLVNETIAGFQKERDAASKVIVWAAGEANCNTPNKNDDSMHAWICGAYDLALDYKHGAEDMIKVLATVQTALQSEIHKAVVLANFTLPSVQPARRWWR